MSVAELKIGGDFGARLFGHHQEILRASAIDPKVAEERNYRTVTEKSVLEKLRFAPEQRRVPGLLIPVQSTAGIVATYQFRPDEPRVDPKRGRPIKYETPAGSRIAIDCPTRVQPHLLDPTRPLIITEGVRKADAAVSAGHDCIALLGVWNWQRNKAALPDWRDIALEGRAVRLAFDSDAATNPNVAHALAELAAWLEHRGATVEVLDLPAGPGNTKVGLDDWLAAGHTIDELDIASPRAATIDLPDVDRFLAEPDAEYDWSIPGITEHGDRLIVTGPEGAGKSTWLRQLAVQAAAGVHPFTGEPFDPLNVLLVDLENSRRHIRRAIRPLRIRAGQQLETGRLRIASHPEGINLLGVDDAQWLEQRIEAADAELVIIGPLYKLHDGDPIDEQPAKRIAAFIDHMRAAHGITVIMEAHTPYASNNTKRPLRPYGASLWSRWPEFGIHLDATGQLDHWRGQRDERAWPAALTRGGDWPWTVAQQTRADEPEWHGPTRCMDAIVHLLNGSGEELSTNQLEDRLRAAGNSYRTQTVRQAAEQAAMDGQLKVRNGPRRSRLFRAPTTTQELT